MKAILLPLLALSMASLARAAEPALETKPADAYFDKFQPRKAPAPAGLVLQKGDRLAIIGDSITEQKLYSRIMETYLTVCVPELEVTVRQFGWGGETAGHEVTGAKEGTVELTSSRYPFCADGPLDADSSIRSGMSLVPFNAELNRFTLVARGGTAANYKVTWGSGSKVYSAEQLARGVNLADDFGTNPFSAAFKAVDSAVAAKQGYETRQIKDVFHGPEFRLEPDTMVRLTEKVRAPLAAAIPKAFVPVNHTIRIEAN